MFGPRQWTKQHPSLVIGLEALALRSPHALLIRLALNPFVDVSRDQLVGGQVMPSAGWLLTANLLPVPDSQIAKMCILTEEQAQAGIAELLAVGIALRSDEGALGLAGWALTQVTAGAMTKRDQRAKEREDKGRTKKGQKADSAGDMSHATSLSLFSSLSSSSSSSSTPSGTKTDLVMDTWHNLRIDLGILKARAHARRANEGEAQDIDRIDGDELLVALRRMAEHVRRVGEEEGLSPARCSAARFFTVDHLLRLSNRQRYLDNPDLDHRRPQQPKKQTRHFKPGVFSDDDQP